jgi:hypothetical protein
MTQQFFTIVGGYFLKKPYDVFSSYKTVVRHCQATFLKQQPRRVTLNKRSETSFRYLPKQQDNVRLRKVAPFECLKRKPPDYGRGANRKQATESLRSSAEPNLSEDIYKQDQALEVTH